MRKIILLCIAFAGIAVISSSCGRSKKIITTETTTEIITDGGHSASTSLDYEGTYEGTLPCADCPGIKTTLELSGDKYKMRMEYLERGEESTYNSEGTYSWNEEGNTITLNGEGVPEKYFVGENVLYRLDSDGNKIAGELAEHYKLMKKH